MSTSTTPTTDVPDVLGMKLAHRVILKDLDRTTALAEGLAAGTVPATRRRVKAFTRYLGLLADSVHHHHTVEDEILWPVIERRAGSAIDLTALTDDHSALDPKLDGIRAAVLELAASPSSRPVAATLATRLAEVRDLLAEHIAEEERDTFPIIQRFLSVADWKDVEAKIHKSGGKLGFEAPRVVAVATPEEFAAIKADAGFAIVVILALITPRFRRMEKAIWG